MSTQAVADFWKSIQGLLTRLADIAHAFTWGTFNSAQSQMLAVIEADPETPPEEKGRKLTWQTMEDDKVCELCEENAGEYEPDDPLLPEMPGHVMCRCYWSIEA